MASLRDFWRIEMEQRTEPFQSLQTQSWSVICGRTTDFKLFSMDCVTIILSSTVSITPAFLIGLRKEPACCWRRAFRARKRLLRLMTSFRERHCAKPLAAFTWYQADGMNSDAFRCRGGRDMHGRK